MRKRQSVFFGHPYIELSIDDMMTTHYRYPRKLELARLPELVSSCVEEVVTLELADRIDAAVPAAPDARAYFAVMLQRTQPDALRTLMQEVQYLTGYEALE